MPSNLITDRTWQDYEYYLELHQTLIENTATSSQRAEYLSEMRGRYGVHTLNRVGRRMVEITEPLPMWVTPKTNFNFTDLADEQAQTQLNHYLNELQLTRNVAVRLFQRVSFPQLPSSMENLTLEDANNIERMLWTIWDIYDRFGIKYFRANQLFTVSGIEHHYWGGTDKLPMPGLPIIHSKTLLTAIQGTPFYFDFITVTDSSRLPTRIFISVGRLPYGFNLTRATNNPPTSQVDIRGMTMEVGTFPFTLEAENVNNVFNFIRTLQNFVIVVRPVHIFQMSGDMFSVSGDTGLFKELA